MNWPVYLGVLAFVLIMSTFWDEFSRLGADLGRTLARAQIEALRQQQAMADLQARLAAERWRSSGFPAGERVRALQAGGVAYPRRTLLARQYDRQQAARD